MDDILEARYNKWRGYAARAARSVLHDASLAEDILQDAMLKLKKGGHEIDDTLKDNLVYITIQSCAIDQYRYLRRRPTPTAVDVEQLPALDDAPPEVRREEPQQAVRSLLDRLLKRYEQGGEVDYWAVFLVRARSTVGRMWISDLDLDEQTPESLMGRFDAALRWHEEERKRKIKPDWSILDLIWERCVHVIRRDGLLRPRALCEALEGVVPAVPAHNTWTAWESRARKHIGRIALDDAQTLTKLVDLMERDAR